MRELVLGARRAVGDGVRRARDGARGGVDGAVLERAERAGRLLARALGGGGGAGRRVLGGALVARVSG